jgi:uncharacterized protein YdiU (UPF0061 family)
MPKLTELPWEARFVTRFPGDSEPANFTRRVRNVCYSKVSPMPVSAPRLIGWAEAFADELGIAKPEDSSSVEALAGNRILPGMQPYAARYGGHQFGQWAGQLGDGRAITLGEVSFPSKGRWEFQLKGAGPTPYSRTADGRAVLRSSLREFMCSEAMHFLGAPTTRALSLVSTGEVVIRDMFYDGNPKPEPGAIVCRVSPSFLRFGNFEILAASGELDLLKKLTDFIIEDHYPELDVKDPDVYGQFMDEISRRTAEMIVHWQRVGFVHGVMNTDNMSAIGLTIDYGPYGWLEPYDPTWTPNTTDAGQGRYRYGYQPAVALWNLSRLGGALFPLIDNEDRIDRSLDGFKGTFQKSMHQMSLRKLGLSGDESPDDLKLIEDLYELLQATETDYTLFFRRISDWSVTAGSNDQEFMRLISPAFYSDDIDLALRTRWLDWSKQYARRILESGASNIDRRQVMKQTNPKYVLRNYLAQTAITAAENGDMSVMERLMRVLKTPYDEHPGEEDLAAKRPEWARNTPGCSALSCSS